jgi:probable O-glycosylation ligase (exosortase A-associated)
MRDLLLLAVYVAFLVLGSAAPFILSLGYVWVDAFRPQDVAYGLLAGLPVAMVMGTAAIGGWLLMDRRSPAPIGLTVFLLLLFAFWVTLSTVEWAQVPGMAWWKWDWAFKTIVFSAFIPMVFRSRVQIEAFLQVYLFAVAAHFLPYAGKTLLSGGGYGVSLGLVQGNSGLAEGATLATVSVAIIPLALFFRRNTRILPNGRVTDLLYLGLVVACVIAAVGTYQRTGLVGLATVAVLTLLRARRKWLAALLITAGAFGVAALTTDAWNTRISTIGEYQQESSALTRLLVWQWTLDFVRVHPFGGGFGVSELSRIVFPGTDDAGEPLVVVGRAFHSIYFEVLGEQGWVGLALFLGLGVSTFLAQRRIIRNVGAHPELAWAADLARALGTSLIVLLVCGAFISIAFQPMYYYLFGISAALLHHVRRSVALLPQAEALVWQRPSAAPIMLPGVIPGHGGSRS